MLMRCKRVVANHLTTFHFYPRGPLDVAELCNTPKTPFNGPFADFAIDPV